MSPGFNAALALFGPGMLIPEFRDDQLPGVDELLDVTLPEDGRYLVVVAGYDTSTGEYTVRRG